MCWDFDLKSKIFCQLFDAFVGAVISYGTEVWGIQSLKNRETTFEIFEKIVKC